MDAVVLRYRGEALREFSLGERPLEVGCAPYCDIVVHDAEVAERALLIRRVHGTVMVHDVRGGSVARARPFPLHAPLPLGSHHDLVRIPSSSASSPPRCRATEEIMREGPASAHGVVIGHGAEARHLSLGGRPVSVGSAPANDLVLSDRAVSAHHCRLEPWGDSLVVRDLGSRNGTWVEGVRVVMARATAGSRLRVGRTDLRVVPRGERGDARACGLVAESPRMLALLGEVERLARLSWPVLVLGESGVGKEGIARALHERGPRARKPFVALNAGGLPRELIESELFGHERGAFTGAVAAHRGVFEQAHGGTLFLDEVGELPLAMQARLLRVLETWEVRRVGGESSVPVDVRLVCATHRNLRAMVGEGTFRRDLYYRLARLVVEVPPLRTRVDDIQALAAHFLAQMRPDVGVRMLSAAAMARLLAYRWPGNVRELKNVLGAAAVGAPDEVVSADDVERAMAQLGGHAGAADHPTPEAVHEVLERYGGNVSAVARALGMPRSTLRDRLRRGGAALTG
jgi:DNA-binding NtrC family response regulator